MQEPVSLSGIKGEIVVSIIINADDFGMSPEINRAVIDLFDLGYLRDCSLAVNMDCASEALALTSRSPGLCVGIHLNITGGKPVLPPDELPALVNDAGEFVFNESALIGSLSRLRERTQDEAALLQVAREIEAQVECVLERAIVPSHMDFHHYFNQVSRRMFEISLEIASRYEIDVLRGPSERLAEAMGLTAWEYEGMVDLLRSSDLTSPGATVFVPVMDEQDIDFERYAEIIEKELEVAALAGHECIELLLHPGHPRDEVSVPGNDPMALTREMDLELLSTQRFRGFLNRCGFELTSHGSCWVAGDTT